MRFVIQRVSESEVKVDGESLGKIGKGFLVLIGVSDSDTKEIADKMVKKMLGLHSLHCMRTVRKGTAPASSERGRRTWRQICTSTLSASAKSR